MDTRTILITGGGRGLGLECARAVARKGEGWHLALAVRDPGSASEAVESLRGSAAGVPVSVLPLDLASFASVREFPATLSTAKLPPLGAIVCNAGIQQVAAPTRTVDGIETTFAVNHLGHFLLTQLLLNRLEPRGRIVLVASNTHDPEQKTGMPAPRFTTVRDLANDDESGTTAGQRHYTTSKLCNVFYAYELARRLEASPVPALRSVKVDAFDPGLMPGTGLARDYGVLQQLAWRFVLPALTLFARNVNTPSRSGDRLAALATSDAEETGRYMSDGVFTRSSTESYDRGKAQELWEESLALTGVTPVETALGA